MPRGDLTLEEISAEKSLALSDDDAGGTQDRPDSREMADGCDRCGIPGKMSRSRLVGSSTGSGLEGG